MTDQVTTNFKAHLRVNLLCYPDLAELACRQLWLCLSDDIRDVVCTSDRYLASVEINRVGYHALVIDFPVANPLSERCHLEKLEEICRVSYKLTGLTHVAAIHRRHGVMAEFNAESEPKYTLWSF